MTSLPPSGYIEANARTVGEQKQALEDVRSVIAEMLGGQAETELTIGSGSVTPDRGAHAIDTESDAASDDLTNLAIANHPDGRFVLIHAVDGSRQVVVKNAAGGDGQVYTVDGQDLTLSDPTIHLLLQRRGTVWHEVGRWYGAAKSAHRKFYELDFNTKLKNLVFDQNNIPLYEEP